MEPTDLQWIQDAEDRLKHTRESIEQSGLNVSALDARYLVRHLDKKIADLKAALEKAETENEHYRKQLADTQDIATPLMDAGADEINSLREQLAAMTAERDAKLVSCDECAFTYNALHVCEDGEHRCPQCGERKAEQQRDTLAGALKDEIAWLERAINAAATNNQHRRIFPGTQNKV